MGLSHGWEAEVGFAKEKVPVVRTRRVDFYKLCARYRERFHQHPTAELYETLWEQSAQSSSTSTSVISSSE